MKILDNIEFWVIVSGATIAVVIIVLLIAGD